MKTKSLREKSSRKSKRSSLGSKKSSPRKSKKSSRRSKKSSRRSKKSSRRSKRSSRKSKKSSRRSKKSSRRSKKSSRRSKKSSRKSKRSSRKSKRSSRKSKRSFKKKYSVDEKLIIKELNKILSKINLNTTNFKFVKEKLKEKLNIDISLYKQFIKDEINVWIYKKIDSEISKVIKKVDIQSFTLKDLINHLEKKLKMSLSEQRKYIKNEVKRYL